VAVSSSAASSTVAKITVDGCRRRVGHLMNVDNSDKTVDRSIERLNRSVDPFPDWFDKVELSSNRLSKDVRVNHIERQ